MPSLNQAVADAARSRWPDRGTAWVAALPAELVEICQALAVTPTGRTFAARFAHVVEATTRNGAHLILRSSPDPDATHQAAVLEHLARIDLAPAVHLVRDTSTSTWTAMDVVSPGTALTHGNVSTDELSSVTPMLRILGTETAGPPSAPSIVPWLRTRLTDPPTDDQPPHRSAEPEKVRHTAVAVLAQLATTAPTALCHGDLSPPNVLRSQSRLWFIDPRGMNGDATYDIAVFALKASADDCGAARQLAGRLANASGNDADRAAAWITVVDAATV
ncbi:phosphotransferase [Pseudonocardia nantongensis]|uniref:phosphotransferase n=1 Tax=Pseudonocardia nantongensis TaxID=1181885 RepID=UPI00397A2583